MLNSYANHTYRRAWPARRCGSAPLAADSFPDSLAALDAVISPAAMLTRAAREMAGVQAMTTWRVSQPGLGALAAGTLASTY